MHSAVMQNKKYIEFARDNTVEILALGSLDEAVTKKDKKAQAYKAKGPDGQDVLFMIEWPNLTYNDIMALQSSPGGQYNKTGRIPYTSLVDPHTLQEVERLGSSAKSIMDSAEAYRKKLQKEHGKGMTRKDLEKFNEAERNADAAITAKEYAKAADALGKVSLKDPPAPLKTRTEAMRSKITSAAQTELSAIEEAAKTDAAKAKKDLSSLLPRLRGTGLEEKAKVLLKSLSTAS